MALIYEGMPCAICGQPLDTGGPTGVCVTLIGFAIFFVMFARGMAAF